MERTEPSRTGLVLVTGAGTFLVLLDVTVVNVAVPAITAGTAGAQWVVDGHTVALAGLLLAVAARQPGRESPRPTRCRRNRG